MHTYLISCDLATRDGTADMTGLAAAIRDVAEAWARPLECTWYVRSSLSQQEIEARLAAHIGDDDGLLIQPVLADGCMLNTALRWMHPPRPRDVIRPGEAGGDGEAQSPRRVLAFPATRARRPAGRSQIMASKP